MCTILQIILHVLLLVTVLSELTRIPVIQEITIHEPQLKSMEMCVDRNLDYHEQF
jgi:hypothetical protein